MRMILSLIVSQIAQLQIKSCQLSSGYCVGFDGLRFFLHFPADLGQENVVSVGERQIPGGNQQRQHAPVDQVGAVALGGVLVGYVGPASPALSGRKPPALWRSRPRASQRKWWSRCPDCCYLHPPKVCFTVSSTACSSGRAAMGSSPASRAFSAPLHFFCPSHVGRILPGQSGTLPGPGDWTGRKRSPRRGSAHRWWVTGSWISETTFQQQMFRQGRHLGASL